MHTARTLRNRFLLTAVLAVVLGSAPMPAHAASKEIIELQTQVQQLLDMMQRLQSTMDTRFGVLQHLAQQTVIPACRLGKPVVRDIEGSCLCRCQMLQADDRHVTSAEPLQRLDPAMAGKHLVIPVHQDRNVEPKTLDTAGDLPDLPGVVLPRILWIEPDLTDGEVLDRQRFGILRTHFALLTNAQTMRADQENRHKMNSR